MPPPPNALCSTKFIALIPGRSNLKTTQMHSFSDMPETVTWMEAASVQDVTDMFRKAHVCALPNLSELSSCCQGMEEHIP